jgi:hypothetical protein
VIEVSEAAKRGETERVRIEYEYAPGEAREATGKVIEHPERLLDTALIQNNTPPEGPNYRVRDYGVLEERLISYRPSIPPTWKSVGFLTSVESSDAEL